MNHNWIDLLEASDKLFGSKIPERDPKKLRKLKEMMLRVSRQHHRDLNVNFGEGLRNESFLEEKPFSQETEKLFYEFLEELRKEGVI